MEERHMAKDDLERSRLELLSRGQSNPKVATGMRLAELASRWVQPPVYVSSSKVFFSTSTSTESGR